MVANEKHKQSVFDDFVKIDIWNPLQKKNNK